MPWTPAKTTRRTTSWKSLLKKTTSSTTRTRSRTEATRRTTNNSFDEGAGGLGLASQLRPALRLQHRAGVCQGAGGPQHGAMVEGVRSRAKVVEHAVRRGQSGCERRHDEVAQVADAVHGVAR